MGVLFMSSRPLGRCENVTAIYDAWDGGKSFALIRGDGTCPELDGMRADVVVTDEFAPRFAWRDACKVVQVGHGLFGGKSYGFSQPRPYCTDRETPDFVVATSRYSVPRMAAMHGVDESRVLPLGMPRTDAYVGKRKGDGGAFLAKFERAYLLAPTHRFGGEPAAPAIDWRAVDEGLLDDEVLAVKRHMLDCGKLPGGLAHVVEVDGLEPSTPYLIDCDVVMTDYSSIVLDGYLLGKPSVLYCPDRQEYLGARGMYFDYPHGYSSRWLMADCDEAIPGMLRKAASGGMGEAERECRELAADMCDGHSTERVVELVRSLT